MYALLGHSRINRVNVKKVPNGTTLVLLAKCGRQFNKNNKFEKIFKNQNKINNYLGNQMQNKNVYTAGSSYTNQVIHLSALNNLPHGLIQLPTNIHTIRNSNSLAHGNIKISNALQIIKDKGGGIMFGVFCRGTKGVRKLNSGVKILFYKKPHQLIIKKGQKGPFGPIYNKVLRKRKEIKKLVKTAPFKTYMVPKKSPVKLNYGNF